MQDIVPDAGIGLHLASNTWYNTALACEVNINININSNINCASS